MNGRFANWALWSTERNTPATIVEATNESSPRPWLWLVGLLWSFWWVCVEGGGYSSVVNERGLSEVTYRLVIACLVWWRQVNLLFSAEQAWRSRGKLLPQSTLGGSAGPSQAPNRHAPGTLFPCLGWSLQVWLKQNVLFSWEYFSWLVTMFIPQRCREWGHCFRVTTVAPAP